MGTMTPKDVGQPHNGGLFTGAHGRKAKVHNAGMFHLGENNECKAWEEDAMMTAIKHILGDNIEDQNMATISTDDVTPPQVYVEVGQVPQYKGISTALDFSSGTAEVDAVVKMDRVGNGVTIDPSIPSIEHGLIVPSNSINGPYVHPPLGPSLEMTSHVEGYQYKTPKDGMSNNADMKDAPYERDYVRKSSNLVICIKRRLPY
ncbi:hypothetical protein Cgig2_026445 [Carnegiea gigantea]|uniref:Uncharacterized protein n=1 Tax=Carnegiea gigantea TaxID=171969 RepID=A0A9Q1KPC9_9CARY|nr:hypothetical protein Cgig2_026445 [Carnegiea gigantea]